MVFAEALICGHLDGSVGDVLLIDGAPVLVGLVLHKAAGLDHGALLREGSVQSATWRTQWRYLVFHNHHLPLHGARTTYDSVDSSSPHRQMKGQREECMASMHTSMSAFLQGICSGIGTPLIPGHPSTADVTGEDATFTSLRHSNEEATLAGY